MATIPVPPRLTTSIPSIYEFCQFTDPSHEIRLLQVHEGKFDEPIECSLILRPLVTAPGDGVIPFQALSYYWGSGQAIHEIRILRGDQRRPNSFVVRPNLHSALKCLCDEDEPQFLWVDAICIDQDDDQEKNSQLPLIPEIYSGATNVCIWLGTYIRDDSIEVAGRRL